MAYVPSHFPRYPGMERQDLTQSQLGSFKFTPVDNAPPQAQSSAHQWQNSVAQRQMQQQLHCPVRQLIASDHPQSQSGNLPNFNLSRTSPSCKPPASTLSLATFSDYIKPGLNESRLRFGPAALRSVVESHSPEKERGPENALFGASSSNPRHSRTSGSGSGSSDMNPVASSFVPSAGPSMSHCGLDDISVSTQTMFSALAAEQEAHKHSQMLLEKTTAKLHYEEAEKTRMQQQIKSLVSAVNMLGGIIKHNQSKLKPTDTHARSSDSRSIVNRKSVPVKDAIKPEAQSILYDILARRKAEYAEREQNNFASIDFGSVEDFDTDKQVKSQVDNSELFNLDLLKSPSATSGAQRRKLRQHFLLDSDELVGPVTTSQAQTKKLDDSELIQITSEQVRLAAMEASVLAPESSHPSHPETNPAKTPRAVMAAAVSNGDSNSQNPAEVKIVDTPALKLSCSFLAKYQSRSNKSGMMEAQEKNEKTPGPPKMNANAAKLDDERLSRSTSLDASSTPVERLGPLESEIVSIESPLTQLPPSARPSAGFKGTPLSFPRTSGKVVHNFEPLKIHIRWKVTAESPIYEDEYEKISSIGVQRLPSNQDSRFWKHPVRYIDYTEKNLFRTVVVDYIPLGATYQDVLENIHGGAIEKIELFGPIGRATNYMTARIVFHYELAASMTATHARDHQMEVKGTPVRVWQVITQTYPKNRRLEQDVFENMYTRLLLVNLENAAATEEIKNQMRALIPVKLDWLQSSIIDFGKTVDGFDLIEFTSVAAATQAMEQLRRDVDFGGIEMDFEEDPCSKPYPFCGWEF